MKELITSWLINITIFSLMTTLLMKILPGKTYAPFIRLFCGFILILLFLDPLLSFRGLSDSLAVSVNRELYSLETKQMESELIEAEKEQKEHYETSYREGIESQILKRGEEKGCPLLRVECKLREGEIKKITLVYEDQLSEAKKKEMKKYIQDFYNVNQANIYAVVENSDEE